MVDRALAGARKSGGNAVVVTFEPHPITVLRPGTAPRLLASLPHKTLMLLKQGVEHLLIVQFDRKFAALSAEGFVRQLVEACNDLTQICVGSGWRFGCDRGGDVTLLKKMGEAFDFSVDGLAAVKSSTGEPVSSTAVRNAVQSGDFETAAELLGRDYTVLGQVVEGNHLGANWASRRRIFGYSMNNYHPTASTRSKPSGAMENCFAELATLVFAPRLSVKDSSRECLRCTSSTLTRKSTARNSRSDLSSTCARKRSSTAWMSSRRRSPRMPRWLEGSSGW